MATTKSTQITKSVWVPLGILLKVVDKAKKFNIVVNILDTDHKDDEIELQFDCEAQDKCYLHKIKDLIAEYREDQEDDEDDEDEDD